MVQQPVLGERELDILQEIWRRGSATVGEVHEGLAAQGHDVAYTTVQTMLNRLVAKKVLTLNTADRAHRYGLLLKRKTVVSDAIERIKRRFFEGSTEALVAGLVQEELSDAELERIRALIDKRRKRK